MNTPQLHSSPSLALKTGERALLRPATPDDAAAMAFFAVEASDGMAPWFWAQNDAGRTAMEEGARRAQREDADFSYRNAWLADIETTPAAMLLGFVIAAAAPELDELPPLVRPLVQLEQQVVGSWYINIIATRPEWRGLGIGAELLAFAHALALRNGCAEVSLQNFESNAAARRLYQRFGFREVAREPMPAPPKGSGLPDFRASILHVMPASEALAAPFLR